MNTQREHADQTRDKAFLERAFPLDGYWTAIDHAAKLSKEAGNRRKRRGVRAGIPDWYFQWNGVTLWVEMKAGSSLSYNQKLTRDRLIANGAHWALAKSGEELEAALRHVGIPLRATYGERAARMAAQPAKPKRAPRAAKPVARYTASKGFSKRAAKRGIML